MIYDKLNRQRLDTLHPLVRALAYQWYGKLATAKREVLICRAKASPDDQQHLWESGRVYPGPIVTNARGKPVMESFHGFGVALDFCPVDKDGTLLWKDTKRFTVYAKVAIMVGFEWGGSWVSRLRDYGHLQYTGNLTLAQFQKGKTLPVPPTV